MKKNLILVAAAMAIPSVAFADVNLTFDTNPGKLTVIELNVASGEELRSELTVDDATLKAVHPIASKEAARVVFLKEGQRSPVADLYVQGPADNVVVTIKDGKASYSGTALMEGIGAVKDVVASFNERFRKVMQGESNEDGNAVEAEYYAAIKGMIAANPQSLTTPYAVLMLDGDDFMEAYNALDAAQKEGYFKPMLEKQKASVEKKMRIEQLYRDLESGVKPAPSFSLPNPDGKMVTLEDFRGKWVILDFWGSWCGWCIKGFPDMKKCYAQHCDKMEIVGIDCNDTEEKWRAAVEKHQLPWLHVFHAKSDSVLTQYAVSGFPTKIIINPDGTINKVVMGESQEFYTYIDSILK